MFNKPELILTTFMTKYNVDLTNCDKEPIHIPGRIQSHGFLIAADAFDLAILYVSENVDFYLGKSSSDLLKMDALEFNVFFGSVANDTDLHQLLKLAKNQENFSIINPYKLLIKEEPYYLILHESHGKIIMEFEPATLEYDIQNLIGKSISEILSNKTLSGLLNHAAKEIKDIIEYDRIMVYQFLDDGHGEVVAEVKNDDLEPFFGLHYPASDIPQQARALYKLNYTRIIADVNAASAAIETYAKDMPLDLSHSSLRAVSPIHIQYLKNMGVESSFSISLISKGELWGLIACHNYSPKFIDYKAREGAKLIGQILSSALEYKQAEEETQEDFLLKEAVQELSGQLDKDSDLISSLIRHDVTLLDVTHGSGAGIFFDGHMYTIGVTPDEAALTDLFAWLKETMTESVYHTNQLPKILKSAQDYASVGSGILACTLSRDMGEYIVWFKSEKIAAINWAGNPEKPVEVNSANETVLSPRNSFDTWAEIVNETSDKWRELEISGVLKLREKIVSKINKKANEIRVLNERLKLAYEELDTFSYTISHDLRTPLTSIKSYTELFLHQNQSLDEKGKKLLGRVVAGADKMAFLINEILKLARVGRSDLQPVEIDMTNLVRELITEVVSALSAPQVKIVIGNCPPVMGDLTLITQVFTNLISNAIKYSSRSNLPEVCIDGQVDNEEVIYKIKDNGIGIDVNYHDKVFELFKRMENVKDFQGTGVGLAIVKRIVEKHNGRIWFESELGVGTTFYVAFKNK